MIEAEVEEVELASAVPIFPPRPDAIATLLTSDDFLPGAQTLLYSVKKSLSSKTTYPPELVVLVTHAVSKKVREALYPAFCTRIIEVEPIAFPPDSINKKISSNLSWDKCGLTKLHIFRLEVYETLVFLDADCLAVQDVTPLLELGKVYVESEPLVAAAPDIFPPDKFNAGVLVVRPKQAVFDNMMAQRSLLRTYDGGDTGFLNAYFSDWHRDMPPMSRLPFGYNAQRFLYHCTYAKQPNYWDLAVAPDLTVIHYSSTPKPWEQSTAPEGLAKVAHDHLDGPSSQSVQNSGKPGALEQLWRKWYQRSRNYAIKFHREQKKEQEDMAAAQAALEAARKAAKKKQASTPMDPKQMHKAVTKRYMELRRQGMNTQDAMQQAREECGALKDDEVSASQRVAAMFGVPFL